ncbi:hypothetical protein LH696_04990 [Enterobacter asburiae]|uniref:hypothetical protein n=1 Tax=Enterobacter asburiae TaxID=61645 RepID=UPI001F313DB4|nr:hypothetical protein [Enterobacter asburiae]MCF1339693.1 hypothetical protein [Enterobacter asburiae]MCQ4338074.1 hypothetical protein [Enterobacter asburiae]
MSTITRELAKLFRKITNSEIDAEGNAHVVLSPADSLLINNARIALASLEAEPVCVIDQSNLDYLKSGSDADVWPASRAEMGDVLLYRSATPAPVSVPAAMEMDDDFDSAFEHGKAVGWNAYRAAMLQGAEPVTTAYKLPPHIFRELVNRLRDTAVKYQGCQQLREQLSRTLQEVIQPAEPQQEVTQALAKGMERYGDAMQKLADSGD